MSKTADALWLSVSPSLRRLDQPLLRELSQQVSIAQWEYSQTLDEPCCLDTAITLLHDYLKQCDHPVHLLGHSVSGLIGLLYTRQYPKRVKSLTLLSVAVHPAVNWQAHYYVLRQLLSCSRQIILSQMVQLLFGKQSRSMTQRLIYLLEQDLDSGFSLHSLVHRTCLPPGGVDIPLMVCSSASDLIIAPHSQGQWRPYLKPTDRFWEYPEGAHFFHSFYPQPVSQAIFEFWFEGNKEGEANRKRLTENGKQKVER
ncbi:MAG: alpha/beta hydrolase [Pseudanabaenales cyanobacterium]|nr:alpha/beta hydrolase [Pseudanabaenales cyanobacterium]